MVRLIFVLFCIFIFYLPVLTTPSLIFRCQTDTQEFSENDSENIRFKKSFSTCKDYFIIRLRHERFFCQLPYHPCCPFCPLCPLCQCCPCCTAVQLQVCKKYEKITNSFFASFCFKKVFGGLRNVKLLWLLVEKRVLLRFGFLKYWPRYQDTI